MQTKFNRFPDDLIYQAVQDYLTTEITVSELMKKYNFGCPNTLYSWIKKLGISKQDFEQLKQDRVKASAISKKSSRELDLEHKIRLLEDELNKEKLKTAALSTLIDIAERDLQIDIKKKRGAKQ